MLSLIIGPPRSGKTYRAVKEINDEFKKYNSNSSKYKNIYCNIVGFKFERFDGFVIPFDKLDFISAVQQEYTLNKQYESGFINANGDYDKYAIKSGIYEKYHHCLIVLDEAYNTFNKIFDETLGRFLSYHGHFGIDIIFLLQSKRQTNREYLVHTELLYVAQSSGKRLISTLFRYKVYSTYEERKGNLIETQNLKFDKKISEIYNSGSTQIYKSYATGKILFLVLFSFFSYVIYQFLSPSNTQSNSQSSFERFDENITSSKTLDLKNIQSSNTKNEFIDDRRIYKKITCFPAYCKFYNYSLDLSFDSFLILLSDSNCKIILTDKKSSNYINYYLSCPIEFSNFLMNFENNNINKSTYKGSQNEKNNPIGFGRL